MGKKIDFTKVGLAINGKTLLNLSVVDCGLNIEHHTAEFNNAEEKLVKQVLRMVLKREPKIKDAKRLTKLIYQHREGYVIAFDGVEIGDVKMNTSYNNFGFEFTPKDEFS